MTRKLVLQELSYTNKKVLMRVDFNVPFDAQGNITDDTRIQAVIPSIQYVLKNNGKLILMSHLGRPKGKQAEFSLSPCAKRLSELLQQPVLMAPDCIGAQVRQIINALLPGQIVLLENLRFYEQEEKPEKDASFAQEIASYGDIYVNDAFGTAHRAHSSTAIVPTYFPKMAAAGFLMQKEIQFLGSAIVSPKKPFYAIIGGKKISSKLGVIQSLLGKVDALLIGGGMSYTFFKAQGIMNIGNSIFEPELIDTAKKIMQTCAERNIKFMLPSDIQAGNAFSNEAEIKHVYMNQGGIPDGYEGMDIGPDTIRAFSKAIAESATVLWNGPLGVAEFPRFAQGTQVMAHALATSNAITVVGGGDSVAALQATGLTDKITHISTGGGASLEYIEFGTLPGIEALSDAN